MQSLDRIVYRVLEDLRDPSARRFQKTDVVEAFHEALDVICPDLVEFREDLLANLDNDGQPKLLSFGPAGSDGVSRAALPPTCARIINVEVLTSGVWASIGERKHGAAFHSLRTPTSQALPTEWMTYEIIGGQWIELYPGFTTTIADRVRVKYEVELPKLLMGKVTGQTANTFTLPETLDATEGQLPCEGVTSLYVGLPFRIYSGTGSGASKIYKATAYDGATRILTATPNFNPALVDNDSRFAMMTPFNGVLAPVDKLAIIRTCIVLLGTKRNEDIGTYVARYNELEGKLKSKLENITNETRQIAPVDFLEDAYYR